MIFLYFHLQLQYKYGLFHIYYTSFHSPQEIQTQLIDLASNMWLPSSVEHRTGIAQVTGSNPVEALIFSRLLSSCLSRKIYCDDHSLPSSATASQIWIISYIPHIDNLAKNQASADFHSRAICRSVSPKFIELCMETPCLCPSEGHKHGGCDVAKTSVVEFRYCSRAPTHSNECFFQCKHHLVSKNKVITHLLTYLTAYSGHHFMSHTEKAWKFKPALLRNKKPR